MVDQYDRTVSIGASNPDEVDVAIAVNITRNEITVVVSARSEGKLLILEIAELDTYCLVETVRCKYYLVRFEVCVKFRRQ